MIRRILMWAAAAVLATSVASWLLSLWGVSWGSPGRSGVWLWHGRCVVYDNFALRGPGLRSSPFRWPDWWISGDGFYRSGRVSFTIPHGWFLQFPIWTLTGAALLVFAATWLVGRNARRKQAGFCAACAYDLTGLTGPCPECGKEREA